MYPDGRACQFQGYDGNCLCRSLNGGLVHTKCCAVLEKPRSKDDKISTRDPSASRSRFLFRAMPEKTHHKTRSVLSFRETDPRNHLSLLEECGLCPLDRWSLHGACRITSTRSVSSKYQETHMVAEHMATSQNERNLRFVCVSAIWRAWADASWEVKIPLHK